MHGAWNKVRAGQEERKMTLHQSSVSYGSEMGVGWKKGLEKLFGNTINVLLEQNINRPNNQLEGDIDASLISDEKLTIENLFPTEFIVIRPESLKKVSASKFMAEIKRSINSNLKNKVDQFVRFYNTICSLNKDQLKRRNVPKTLKNLILDQSTVLLFVFNGQDINKVETTMRNSIKSITGGDKMIIAGHQVACVWVNSSELIKWKECMELSEALKKMEQKDKELGQKDKELEQKDKEIKLILEQEEKKRKLLEEELEKSKRKKAR